MNKRTSKSYQFTADVNDINSMFRIHELRNHIKSVNQLSRDSVEGRGMEYRVEVRGRLGKNNPAYEASYKNTRNGTSYIRLEDATRLDVYIYERYQA
jgi:hypothetical protein